MNKQEFLNTLGSKLEGLPKGDIDRSLEFYSEMIDERIEEGASCEEAVRAMGSIDEIVEQILSETPLSKLVKEKVKPHSTLKGWQIALIIIGFPLWFSLIIAALSITFSLYISVWAIIISMHAVSFSLGVSGVAIILTSLIYIPTKNLPGAVFAAGTGSVLLGTAILLFFAFNKITKWILTLSKKALLALKSLFVAKNN